MRPQAVFDRLQNDSCFNIAAAAAIMRYDPTVAHGNLMVAIGDYHSQTPMVNQVYRQKVVAAAIRLFVRQAPG